MMKQFRIILLICILAMVLVPTVASAATITIHNSPSYGIINFTVTQVNDHQLDFNWGYGSPAVSIMIRAKYGAYPDDIPDEDTAPSDGYLIYQGSGTSASDYTVSLDTASTTPLYVRAWGQREDGTWISNDVEQNIVPEGLGMQLLALIALCALLSFIALKYTSIGVAIVASGSWFGLWAFMRLNPLNNVTAGSNVDVILTLILWGVALMLPTVVISRTRTKTMWTKDNDVRGRFFSAPPPETGYRRPSKDNDDDINDYRERIERAYNRGRAGAYRRK